MLCRTTAPPLSSFVFSKRIASLHGGAATSYSSSSSAAAAAAAAAEPARGGDTKRSSWARRAVPVALLGLTGAVALSAVNDLALFLSCSSQAIEKASQNQQIVQAIGDPIVRGPWYNASLAVNPRSHSISCTFPVSGPQGTGIFKLKAVRSGDDTWFSFLQHRQWDILLMDAILDVPSNDGNHQMLKVTVADSSTPPPPPPVDCKECTALACKR
uniref:Uncharacterized protein n=1 Tax=Ananas comosus var. bracteatus TaxID=296719 RepID=A0A6V7NK97_ANACO|nr:unnamed protein product [Ananas comosus var. bracteatus]